MTTSESQNSMTMIANSNGHASLRRSQPPVGVRISGRYMLTDKQDHLCSTSTISEHSVTLDAETAPELDEPVIVYLQHLGRLEGRAINVCPEAFTLDLDTNKMQREKINAHLTWLENWHIAERPRVRRHERIVPIHRFCTVKSTNGHEQIVKLIDLSLSGAAFQLHGRCAASLMVGSHVELGSRGARIVRIDRNSAFAEFDLGIDAEKFDESIML